MGRDTLHNYSSSGTTISYGGLGGNILKLHGPFAFGRWPETHGFIGACETDKGSSTSLETGLGVDIQAAEVYCKVGDIDGDREDTKYHLGCLRVQRRKGKECPNHQQDAFPPRGRQKRRFWSSKSRASNVSAVVSLPTSATSALWAFFATREANCTVTIYNLYLQLVECGIDKNHLSTTCLTIHMTKIFTSRL